MVTTETLPAIYLKLENHPGTLERATHVISSRPSNIESISVETLDGTGYARIVTKNAREVIEILKRANFDAHETSLVIASIPNKPGELTRACAELAAAKINIESVLTTPEGRVAFRTSDNDLAVRILTKL